MMTIFLGFLVIEISLQQLCFLKKKKKTLVLCFTAQIQLNFLFLQEVVPTMEQFTELVNAGNLTAVSSVHVLMDFLLVSQLPVIYLSVHQANIWQ